MIKFNQNILNINIENEFMNASKIVKDFKEKNPEKDIISLGIGDVSKPIIKPVIDAMKNAVSDLENIESFHGYGDSSGYSFLKQAILKNDYKGFSFSEDEVYISNGTKTDSSSILELFDINSKICMANPIYPIYKNGAYSLSRNITFLPCKEEDGFVPKVPTEKYDIVYLCSPNNPVGIAYTKDQLKSWIDYAIQNEAIIIYDNAYYAFITSNDVPKSIYEIPGADKVAIEMRSFSKSLSFTGVRCSYYIIPSKICDGINGIWKIRTINRFNGADYIAQRGAEASYREESQALIKKNIACYLKNTKMLKDFFTSLNYTVYGGVDSPFIWVKIKDNMTSWELFRKFLEELNIVVIPGRIFGTEGDSFIRISGLAKEEVIKKAMERIDHYEKE